MPAGRDPLWQAVGPVAAMIFTGAGMGAAIKVERVVSFCGRDEPFWRAAKFRETMLELGALAIAMAGAWGVLRVLAD